MQEEELFKYDLSTYPDIERIHTALEPYQKLFNLALRWQKAEKKWIDGFFVDLDAEAIEAEVSGRVAHVCCLNEIKSDGLNEVISGQNGCQKGKAVSRTCAMVGN